MAHYAEVSLSNRGEIPVGVNRQALGKVEERRLGSEATILMALLIW